MVGAASQSGRAHIATASLLIAQSGGPTTVINASLVGALLAARADRGIDHVYGSVHGIEGALQGDLVDLTMLADDQISRLRRTPSAYLGTSRHRPTDAEVEQLLDTFQAHNITLFTPIGGNDTAETAMRLAKGAEVRGQQLRVVAIPKTIDNDLPSMDHCPGYGSIARYVAHAVRDAAFDTIAMQQLYPIKIVEVMGRNAGWIVAAGSLAFDEQPELPRPVLCLPERPIADLESLKQTVAGRIERDGYAVLVVPETMKWVDGRSVAGEEPEWIDAFGHKYFPGVAAALARELGAALGVRARFDKPGTAARMAMHAASAVDLQEAEEAGAEAVRRGRAGEAGVMVGIQRESGQKRYSVSYNSVPLMQIANNERRLIDEWITTDGHDVLPAYGHWARPLIGAPFEKYEVLGS